MIGTALVETGSRMDDAIFEEFKATGNMELVLDRGIAERRIFPAIDVRRSGTRHDELLFSDEQLKRIWQLRRVLVAPEIEDPTQLLLERLQATKSNKDFLQIVDKTMRNDAD